MSVLRPSLALAAALLPGLAAAQVTVAIDPTADVHPISPLIYGMNFASAAQVAAARIPITRWGGNTTSRYNYEIDVGNSGLDWYFENIPGCWSAAGLWFASPPADPQSQSGANALPAEAARQGRTGIGGGRHGGCFSLRA